MERRKAHLLMRSVKLVERQRLDSQPNELKKGVHQGKGVHTVESCGAEVGVSSRERLSHSYTAGAADSETKQDSLGSNKEEEGEIDGRFAASSAITFEFPTKHRLRSDLPRSLSPGLKPVQIVSLFIETSAVGWGAHKNPPAAYTACPTNPMTLPTT